MQHGARLTRGGGKLFGKCPYTRTTFQKGASLRRVPDERVSLSNSATHVYLDFVFVFGICEGPSCNNSGERVPPSNSATLSRTNLEVGAAATPHFSNQLPHHLEPRPRSIFWTSKTWFSKSLVNFKSFKVFYYSRHGLVKCGVGWQCIFFIFFT